RSIPVDYLHVFTYSERANTTAVRMEDSVPMEMRRDRTKQLRSLSNKVQYAFHQRHLGSIRPVLFEMGEPASARSRAADTAADHINAGSYSGDPSKEPSMEGYTEKYIHVTMPFEPDLVNKIVPVEL